MSVTTVNEHDNTRPDFRRTMFRLRSYTPLPFLAAMVLYAQPTVTSLIVGLVIVAVGEAIRFWGVSIAGSETRTTGGVGGTYLITNGPFAYVRNPLYVGNMVLYSGVGVMSMALFPWLIIAALVWFYVQYAIIVSAEEGYLAGRFGGEYEEYRKHVGRFLPRLTPYAAQNPSPKTVNRREGLSSERRTLQAIAIVTVLLLTVYVIRQWPG